MMNPPIMNLDQLAATRELRHGDKFDAMLAPVGALLGARKLGYNVTTVAPGKRAFPFHNHHVNEELFFVLEGVGTLRYGPDPWVPSSFMPTLAGRLFYHQTLAGPLEPELN